MLVFLIRTIAISTAVMYLPNSGKMQARPKGSGKRAIRVSPSSRNVQLSSLSLLSVLYLSDLSLKSPYPISAS